MPWTKVPTFGGWGMVHPARGHMAHVCHNLRQTLGPKATANAMALHLAVTAMNPQSALPLMYLITRYDGQADLVLGAFLLTTPVLCYW